MAGQPAGPTIARTEFRMRNSAPGRLKAGLRTAGLQTGASIQLQHLVEALRGAHEVLETGHGIGRHEVAVELPPSRGGQVVFVEDPISVAGNGVNRDQDLAIDMEDRKSTRLNSSH